MIASCRLEWMSCSASTHGHRLHDAAAAAAGAEIIIILTAIALAQDIDANGDLSRTMLTTSCTGKAIAGRGQKLAHENHCVIIRNIAQFSVDCGALDRLDRRDFVPLL